MDLSAKPAQGFPEFPVNLAADATFALELTEPVVAEVYGRLNADIEAEPILLGSTVVTAAGGTVTATVPGLGTQDYLLFLRPRTGAKQIEGVTDLRNAVQKVVNFNTETLVPEIYESAAATNTVVTIGVVNYSPSARFRHIQTSLTSDFAPPNDLPIQTTTNEPGALLDPTLEITRSTNLTVAEDRFIRVRHSSNGTIYGEWSNELEVTYAASGGGGGSGGGDPPPHCFTGDTITTLYHADTGIERILFADLYRRYNTFEGDKYAKSYNDAGEAVAGRIENMVREVKKEWLYVVFAHDKFEVTHKEPFMTAQGYKNIEDIQIGEMVKYGDALFGELLTKDERKGMKEFFNMEIEDTPNFTVGVSETRVHNKPIDELQE